MNKRDLHQVIKNAKRGDPESVEYLLEHYKPRIEKTIDKLFQKYKKDFGCQFVCDREDLIQEGYVAVLTLLKSDVKFAQNIGFFIYNHIQEQLIKKNSKSKMSTEYMLSGEAREKAKSGKLVCTNWESLGLNIPQHPLTGPESVDEAEFYKKFHEMLKRRLSPKAYDMVYSKYVKNETLEVIGKRYNVGKERTRQIINQSLIKFKQSVGYDETLEKTFSEWFEENYGEKSRAKYIHR